MKKGATGICWGDLSWPKGKAIIFLKERQEQLLSCYIQELFHFQARFILLNVSHFIKARHFPSLDPASLKLGYGCNLYDKRAVKAKFREGDFFC